MLIDFEETLVGIMGGLGPGESAPCAVGLANIGEGLRRIGDAIVLESFVPLLELTKSVLGVGNAWKVVNVFESSSSYHYLNIRRMVDGSHNSWSTYLLHNAIDRSCPPFKRLRQRLELGIHSSLPLLLLFLWAIPLLASADGIFM